MSKAADNFKLSFGAKYKAEDAASDILHKFDRNTLSGTAVSMERFARCLGLSVRCETITGDCTESLGVVAFEPQRIYTVDGAVDLPTPAAVVERDVIDRGESGLYNFALALMCAESLFFGMRNDQEAQAQLSFGLDTVSSSRFKTVSLTEAFEEIARTDDCASNFALRLVLPKNGFKRQTMELYAQLGVNRATVDEQEHLPHILSSLAAHYTVPEVAVLARLRQLNLY